MVGATVSPEAQSAEFLHDFRALVFKCWPALVAFCMKASGIALGEYLSELHEPRGVRPNAIAQAALRSVASRTLTEDELARFEKSLAAGVTVNVADHVGLPFHAEWLQANLANVIGAPGKVALSAGSSLISVNNVFRPGQVRWFDTKRLLVPNSQRTKSVLVVPAVTREQYESRMADELQAMIPYDSLSGSSFREQMHSFASQMWRQLSFLDGEYAVAFTSAEQLASEILIEDFAVHGFWYHALQSEQWLTDFVAGVRGAPYGWNASGGGSELFWHVDIQGGKLRRLELDGLTLRGSSESFRLGPELAQSLKDCSLVPTSLVTLLVLASNGVNTSGGINHISRFPEVIARAVPHIEQLDRERADLLRTYATDRFVQMYGVTLDDNAEKARLEFVTLNPQDARESLRDVLDTNFLDVLEITAYVDLLRFADRGRGVVPEKFLNMHGAHVYAAKFEPSDFIEYYLTDWL